MSTTEELRDHTWHDLEIPPPGGYCGDQFSSLDPDLTGVYCSQRYGHGWRSLGDGLLRCGYCPATRAEHPHQTNTLSR